jgi:polysaccharide export outer membrane protein
MLRAVLAPILLLFVPFAGGLAAVPDEYRIGPGDVLKISVYRAPDLDGVVRVSAEGSIGVASIGGLRVVDLTATQVADTIGARLKSRGILIEPFVNVLVMEIHSKTASVLGAVQKPGEIILDRPDLKISEVLARAGATFNSDAGQVLLMDPRTNMREQLSLSELASGTQDRVVRPGEILFVQAAPTFFIRGEVTRAGEYAVTPGLTIGKAIALGGGLTERGSPSRVRLERRDKDGTLISERAVRGDVAVQPGDLLIIGARLF